MDDEAKNVAQAMERWRIDAENRKAADQERGYSMKDIAKTREQILNERGRWTHHFDEYVTTLLRDGMAGVNARQIVNTAADIADARAALLAERFPELPAEEEE